MTTKRDFDTVLKAFVKTQGELVSLAREAANMAIVHFDEHGDVSYLQRLHDAFQQNFMRRQALVAWAADHMPLAFSQGKFSKDKRDSAVVPNLAGALAIDFWEYKPEPTVEFYVGSDVIKALNRVLDGFEGKRKEAADENAHKMVVAAKNQIEKLNNILAALPTNNLGDDQPTAPASMN